MADIWERIEKMTKVELEAMNQVFEAKAKGELTTGEKMEWAWIITKLLQLEEDERTALWYDVMGLDPAEVEEYDEG